MRLMRSRTSRETGGRPLRSERDFQVQKRRKPLRCQAHSVRGFLAGTVRKMPGVILISDKTEGGPRRYRIEAVAE